jgi:hypothetical protein
MIKRNSKSQRRHQKETERVSYCENKQYQISMKFENLKLNYSQLLILCFYHYAKFSNSRLCVNLWSCPILFSSNSVLVWHPHARPSPLADDMAESQPQPRGSSPCGPSFCTRTVARPCAVQASVFELHG